MHHSLELGQQDADDKIWLFIQSGPHTGSTLLYEALAGFSDASPLCRLDKVGDKQFGHHAETQTQLYNFSRDWPNWKSAWKLRQYIQDPEWSRSLGADDMAPLASRLDGLWLHPERKVRVSKSPPAVYFTSAFRNTFKELARFIFLVMDPYVHAQHLRQTYFKHLEDMKGYKAAVHMTSDIFKLQHEAAHGSDGDALVMKYEDFTENPGTWLQKIHEVFPEVGKAPETASDMFFKIHGRMAKIKNMNLLYLKALSHKHRTMMTRYFRKYEASISFFGYNLDSHAE